MIVLIPYSVKHTLPHNVVPYLQMRALNSFRQKMNFERFQVKPNVMTLSRDMTNLPGVQNDRVDSLFSKTLFISLPREFGNLVLIPYLVKHTLLHIVVSYFQIRSCIEKKVLLGVWIQKYGKMIEEVCYDCVDSIYSKADSPPLLVRTSRSTNEIHDC